MNENITSHKSNIIDNIAKSFDSQSIQKGIADALSYGSNKLSLSKSGKAIKVGVQAKIQSCTVEKIQMMTEMKEILKHCSIAPTMDTDNYRLKGCKGKLEFIPKLFTWEEADSYVKKTEAIVARHTDEPSKTQNKTNYYRKYNTAARNYIDKCVDVCYLNVIHDGLIDKKLYELTIEQSITLGL